MVVVKISRKICRGLRGIRTVGPTCQVNGRTDTGLRSVGHFRECMLEYACVVCMSACVHEGACMRVGVCVCVCIAKLCHGVSGDIDAFPCRSISLLVSCIPGVRCC